MTHREMFGDAEWISPHCECKTPFIRGHFSALSGEKAEITICGLGFFELYINGSRATQDLFVPADSDYHFFEQQYCYSQFGEITAHRIYCMKYDISPLLVSGDNVIAVFLAPGWYEPYGEVKLCYKIDLDKSGIAVSDDSCIWTRSFITSYDFITGETQDFGSTAYADSWCEAILDESGWMSVKQVPPPDSSFFIQDVPADRVIRCIEPKLISHSGGIKLYDCGENITGRAVVRSTCGFGEKVIVSVGEALDEHGCLDEFYIHDQVSTFISDGRERLMSVRFCWNCFRYIAVTDNADLARCEVIHADIALTSHFECDNEQINWFFDAYVRTQLDNLHAGIPSDCPHMEKRGYTGDGQLCCETVMTMFDAKSLYKKWMDDISDCQDRKTGHVQYTAPYVHSGGGPGGWGCAIIEVPYQFYKAYGDTQPLKKYYPQMLRYFDFLEAHSSDELVVSDMPNEWSLGEWCTPSVGMQGRPDLPEEYVNTYFYVKSLDTMIEIAPLVGAQSDVEGFKALRDKKTAALISHFYDESTGDFASNKEGANAFAVDIGLGDRRTFDNMRRHYDERGLFDTGIFGTELVPRLLFDEGFADIAIRLIASDGVPSFGSWKKRGATTLWEEWINPRSLCHPMFGAVAKILFSRILGIRADAGYKRITVKPELGTLSFARGYITPPCGKIEVSVLSQDGTLTIDITLENDIDAVLEQSGATQKLHKGKNTFVLPDETK